MIFYKRMHRQIAAILAALMIITSMPTATIPVYATENNLQEDTMAENKATTTEQESINVDVVAETSDEDNLLSEGVQKDIVKDADYTNKTDEQQEDFKDEPLLKIEEEEQPDGAEIITDQEGAVEINELPPSLAEMPEIVGESLVVEWSKDKPGYVVIKYHESLVGKTAEIDLYTIDANDSYIQENVHHYSSPFENFLVKQENSENGYYTLEYDCRPYIINATEYRFVMYIFGSEGESVWNDAYYSYPGPRRNERLSTPQILTVDYENKEISWSEVAGAYEYQITIYRNGDNEAYTFYYGKVAGKRLITTSNSMGEELFKLINSHPNSFYSFTVQALPENIEETGVSYVSNMSESIAIGDVSRLPKGPKDLEWKNGKLSFTCQDSEKYVYYFAFFRNDENIGVFHTSSKVNKKVEEDIYHLFTEPGTYRCEIGIYEKTSGSYIIPSRYIYVYCDIPENTPKLSPVTDLKWEKRSNKIYATWKPVEGATHYYLEVLNYAQLYLKSHIEYDGQSKEISFELPDSAMDNEDVYYTFQVVAYNKESVKNSLASASESSNTLKVSLIQFISQQLKKLKLGETDKIKLYANPSTSETYVNLDATFAEGTPEGTTVKFYDKGKLDSSKPTDATVVITVSGGNLSEDKTKITDVPIKGILDIEVDTNAEGQNLQALAKMTLTATEVDCGWQTNKEYELVPNISGPSLEGERYICITNIDQSIEEMDTNNLKEEENQSDTVLPKGWQWVNPKQALASYMGASKVDFPVAYKNDITNEIINDTVPVYFYTLKGLDVTYKVDGDEAAEERVINKFGTKETVQLLTRELWQLPEGEVNAPNREDINNAVTEWKVTKGTCVTVNKTQDGVWKLETGENAGTATIEVSYTVGSKKIYTKSYNITVADNTFDFSKLSIVDDDIEVNAQNDIYTLLIKEGQSYSFKDESEDKYKLSYKSSDTSVLQVDKVGNIKPIKAGTVILTVTTDDAFKSSQEYKIKVIDRSTNSIALGFTSVTFNKAASLSDKVIAEAYIPVYDGCGGKVLDVDYSDENIDKEQTGIQVDESEDGKGMVVKALQDNANALKNQKIKVTVTIDREPQESDSSEGTVSKDFEINIKWNNQAPDITIVQTKAFDTLFKESEAKFDITSTSGAVTNIVIRNLEEGAYSITNSEVEIKKLPTKNKLNIEVTVDGYKTVSKTITVKTMKTSYALSATTGTYYSDKDNVLVVGVQNKTAKKEELFENIGNEESGSDDSLPVRLGTDSVSSKYFIGLVEGKIRIYTVSADAAKNGDKITLFIDKTSSGELITPLKFTYTVKVLTTKSTSLELGAKSITLYNYADRYAETGTIISLKGGYYDADSIPYISVKEVVSMNLGASQNRTLQVSLNHETGEILVRKASSDLKAGTYKYQFELVDYSLAKRPTATLSIKVVNVAEGNAKVTVSAKNTVDILDRKNTSIKLTPKFTNVAKDATTKLVKLEGRDAAMFSIIEDTGAIQLKSDAVVSTKETYLVKAVYRVDSNGALFTLTSSDLKVKFKAGKATTKITGNASFGNREEDRDLTVSLTSSSKNPVTIKRVELLNYNKDFKLESNKNEVTQKMEYILKYTPNGETARGKSYTLKFNVYPEGASVNDKPVTVNYKVNIVK